MPRIRFAIVLFASMLIGTPVMYADDPTPQQVEFFEKKIRPIFATTCHKCHSAKTKQRGELQLDNRALMLKGGESGPAVVVNHPEKSLLFKAVSYVDPDLRMPPRKKLTAAQIADVKTWIKMGAPWPTTDNVAKKINKKGIDLVERGKFWSFQPVRRSELPDVKDKNWPLNPIDRFILAKIERKGLSPNPPAERRTLLRRVTFDLTGLPPTEKEINDFLNDKSPKAYEKVVERLLDSPHYGERWARHWLDLTRFAETYGHEFDFVIPDAYRYRDYLIRAFNNNVPYDQFVLEHVAGDLLPNPRRHPTEKYNESILATGFWWLGEAKHSPVDSRGDQGDRIDNQIDVFSKTFLGLTVACAKCHDHKFDAITQRDYYAMVGYLQSSRYQRAFFEDHSLIHQRVAELLKVRSELAGKLLKNVAPERPAKTKPQPRYTRFAEFSSPTFQAWYATGAAFGTGPSGVGEIIVRGDANRPDIRRVKPHVAHSGLVSNRLQGVLRSKSFKITGSRIHYRIAGRGSRIRLILDGLQLIRNPIYGGLQFNVNHGDGFRWHSQNVGMWKGHRAYIEVMDEGGGWIAVDDVVFSDEGRPPAQPNQPLLQPVDVKGVPADELRKLMTAYRQAEGAIPGRQRALAMTDGSPVDEWLSIRGNHKNRGDKVNRRFLEVFVGDDPAPGTKSGSGRLQLAKRLVSPDNPFTARVMVNRIWKHHFGDGIVKSVDNFGKLGELPSHPKLLDWLASEFVKRKWSIREMHKLMLLSRTYRMSSKTQNAAKTIDPNNVLLHRMPVRRLEGEAIRDALLAISGRLDKRMYGPGVMPHLTPHMAGRGRPRDSGPLDGAGRRSIYINVRRNFLTPFFLVFDYPVPFSSMGRRSVSNVPLQALTMMNNPFVIQQTKLWAKTSLEKKGITVEQRIERMYVRALGRPPRKMETQQMAAFVREQSKLYGAMDHPRAWEDLAHVMVNLKEFIYVN